MVHVFAVKKEENSVEQGKGNVGAIANILKMKNINSQSIFVHGRSSPVTALRWDAIPKEKYFVRMKHFDRI